MTILRGEGYLLLVDLSEDEDPEKGGGGGAGGTCRKEASLLKDCREAESWTLSTLRSSEEDLLWVGMDAKTSPAVILRRYRLLMERSLTAS